jgi:hypothetical protein
MSSSRLPAVGLGLWLAMLLLIASARPESVFLPAVADSGLREIIPDRSGGTDPGLRVGTTASQSTNSRARALFLFNPTTAIPPGSIITAARLSLTVSNTTDTVPHSFDLRRMLVPWAENEATWLVRLPPDIRWTAPGGDEGVDYSTTASDSIVVGGLGAYSWGSTTGMVADVQRWLEDPAMNFGWMLVRPEEATPRTTRLFNSRETSSGQPQLAVEFAVRLHIAFARLANNQLCLEFQARAGAAYVVQRRGQVDGGAWALVTNLPPAESDGLVTVCDPLGLAPQFYRIGRQ